MSKLTKNSSSFDSLCIPKESKLDSDETLKTCKVETPIGEMIAISDDDYLYVLQNVDSKRLQSNLRQLKNDTSKDLVVGETKILANLKKEMSLYFEGKLKEWTIPLKFIGTDFQKECWTKLRTLDFGKTMTYGQLASQLGKGPRYSRAVGSAAGANPLLLLVPCHRLVACGGQGGFSAGKDRKTFLMGHEQKYKN